MLTKSRIGVNGKNVTRTPYQDMVKHYQRHVIEEGQKEVAKNIVKYSNDAKAFYMNNSSNVIKLPSGAYKIPGAPGGIYSESGKILSFWYIGK